MASASPADERIDVFITGASVDARWLPELGREFRRAGLSIVAAPSDREARWLEVAEALQRADALVVLWSDSASKSRSVLSELQRFHELVLRGDEPRLILAVVPGGGDDAPELPPVLREA